MLIYAVLLWPFIGLAVVVIWQPWAILLIAGFCVMGWIGSRQERKHLFALASVRADESICDFARSFDCRQVDTWVIRAVYEEVQRFLPHYGRPFPLHADDDLIKDLKLDGSMDLVEILMAVEDRTGRHADPGHDNPYADKLRRAADLVYYIQHQPRANAAA